MNHVEKKLMEELSRYNEINSYARRLMNEQELPPPPPPAEGEMPPPPPAEGEMPPPPPAEGGDMGAPSPEGEIPMPEDGGVEEIDITDLVNMTKSIKKDMDDSKSENTGLTTKMSDMFSKLDDLESKIANMDTILSKIDELGSKVEQMKEPTPQEKLEMRSLDSYPFNQTPTTFFQDKMGQMSQSGKNEYVLTKQDVESYSPEEIKDSFNADEEENEFEF